MTEKTDKRFSIGQGGQIVLILKAYRGIKQLNT